MYNKKFVASVKCGDRILREQGEDVFLPFGSEYSLFLKNMNSTLAVVNIEIDGRDVLGGTSLVIDPNRTLDLKRFLLENDAGLGPAFKFMEKTDAISESRGDKIEDGIIRVEYRFEKPPMHYRPIGWPKTWGGDVYLGGSDGPCIYNISCGANANSRTYSSNTLGTKGAAGPAGPAGAVGHPGMSVTEMDSSYVPQNDAGITVKGEEIKQDFVEAAVGDLEEETHVICLQLKGQVGADPVKRPLTTKRKIKCPECNFINGSTVRFCGQCATNLNY